MISLLYDLASVAYLLTFLYVFATVVCVILVIVFLYELFRWLFFRRFDR